jgi:MFS family permease
MATSKPLYGNLIAAIATVAACDMSLGLTLQLIPLLQHAHGTPAWLIGLVTSMGPLGILLTGPMLPHLVKTRGAKTVAYGAIACIVLGLLGFAATSWLPIWFAMRFIMGAATAALFTVSETWIISFTNDQNRGRIMGFYISILAMSFALGPLIIPFTGIEGWKPWLIGIACIAAGSLPLAFVTTTSHLGERSHSFFGVFRRAPLLFAAICTATLFDSVFISFFTIFATTKGVALPVASTMLGFAIIGSAMLFYLIGWLGDHWSRGKVVMLNAAVTVVSCLLLVHFIDTKFAWPLVLILFATAAGVYVVCLASMGDIFKGADLIAGSAAVAAMWGVGGLIGPPLVGAAIDIFGTNAMPYTLATLYAALLMMVTLNGGKLANPVKETA